jgi:hypothetical protein
MTSAVASRILEVSSEALRLARSVVVNPAIRATLRERVGVLIHACATLDIELARRREMSEDERSMLQFKLSEGRLDLSFVQEDAGQAFPTSLRLARVLRARSSP